MLCVRSGGSKQFPADIEDSVVCITGAAGELIGALALAFAARGAALALIDRRQGRLAARFEELADSERVLFVEDIDLTQEEDVRKAVAAILDCFERMNVLVDAAGGYRAGAAVHETDLDLWDGMLALNARTVLLMSRAVVPHMLQQGSGKIVNIGARSGLQGVRCAGAYSAAKAAVLRLTESLAAELRGTGINVNAILPGTMNTQANRQAMPDARQGRWVKLEAVDDVVLFLASEQARAMHGAAVPVYGRAQESGPLAATM